MSSQTRDVLIAGMTYSYNFAMFAGSSYLVYFKDASAWIFAIPICFFLVVKTKDG